MGAFHRRVIITTRGLGPGCGEARAVVEDDYHHFRVVVRGRDGQVAEVTSAAPRYPNTLCPAAGAQLGVLVGMPLSAASAAVLEAADARQQCTHQLDLAGLAVAALAQERRRRVYDLVVPDREDDSTTATLSRDGDPVLSWRISGPGLIGPAPYAGRSLGSGFTSFARTLPLDEAEAALVLRRAVFVSRGRGVDIDALGRGGPVGGCWAWQPERMAELKRLPQSRRDFSQSAELLTADDDGWLSFEA